MPKCNGFAAEIGAFKRVFKQRHVVQRSHHGTARQMHLKMIEIEMKFVFYFQDIRKCFEIHSNDPTFRFGIIGLHPCGDLASILINFFLEHDEPKFLNLVGCCYFKISTSVDADQTHPFRLNSNGYPLSEHLLSNNIDGKWYQLSFEAREIACHAIEVYADRLSRNNYDNLRVHSFRATIEKIICKYWPEYKHSGLRSIKRLTTFREYCTQAISHLGGDIRIPDGDIDSAETVESLNQWRWVVIFYTLRLMQAPLVESVILYDRMLRLLERGKWIQFCCVLNIYRKDIF